MFIETDIKKLSDSPVKMISDDWALLTAGGEQHWNTMTVSWGGVGELWGRDVVFVFVRPQRYTYAFMEEQDTFTLSFFGGTYKKELGLCGKLSGREVDKAAETGLTPMRAGDGVSFRQAQTILVCKKAAFTDIDPKNFVSPEIDKWYLSKDYHRMYVGTIEKVLISDEFTEN